METKRVREDRKKEWWNSFSVRILGMVLLGILLIAVLVSCMVLGMSKNVFTDTYGRSQEKVFLQVEEEWNSFHKNLQNITDAIDASWAFRLYLTEGDHFDNVRTFQNIYQMEKDLEQSKASDLERLNILVMGVGGKHYLSRTETITATDQEIWGSRPVLLAIQEPEILHYTYSHGAYTATGRDTDVIIVSKALYYHESKEIYGVVLITLSMDELKRYYDYFATDNTNIYLVDEENRIICSSDASRVGTIADSAWYRQAEKTGQGRFRMRENGVSLTVMQRELQYLGCRLYGVTDNDLALGRLYNMPLLILLCAGVGAVILILCLFYTRQTLHPLSELVQRMGEIRKGDFDQYMPVEGTTEVQELAATYNYMLDDLQSYINELMETQKARRKSEIKALQMQINPHYIYNTLASIKWLVYQNDRERTVQTIDAFISLLRNTISNTDEFITIDQEVQNLENYILINHTRYGDAVQVEFYVSGNCRDCLLPKMILQPFVENAFFHAFPSGRSGTIEIYMKQKEEELELRIVDDGVGMEQNRAEEAVKQDRNKEHFSGIGIHNVQERLELLYGKQYGVSVNSSPEEGTEVIIRLPANRRQEEGSRKEDDK